MSFENVLTENRDGVLWLTVNRPEKLNALNRATLGEISDVFESLGDDDDVWAAVVTGAGEKAFVAGADISELNTLGPVEAKEFALRGQAIFRQIERLTKPVVAAVNGFALGGGCELAMACHLRVATSNAVFGQPEVKLGLIPGYAGTQRLPRLVGRGRALEILLTGRNVSAEEAEKIGLANSVCEPAELVDTVDATVAEDPRQWASRGRSLHRGGQSWTRPAVRRRLSARSNPVRGRRSERGDARRDLGLSRKAEGPFPLRISADGIHRHR